MFKPSDAGEHCPVARTRTLQCVWANAANAVYAVRGNPAYAIEAANLVITKRLERAHKANALRLARTMEARRKRGAARFSTFSNSRR